MTIGINYNQNNVRLLSRLYSEVDGGRIRVADFPADVSEEKLEGVFQGYGEVVSVKIRNSRKLVPVAFVHMRNPIEGKRAIRELDGSYFAGSRICVKESKELPKPSRYIYALMSKENKSCYIGETSNFESRAKAHLRGRGCSTSATWISNLVAKPSPVILEKVESGYDSEHRALYLETVWRLVAERRGWNVVNPPHLSSLQPDLVEAVEARVNMWPSTVTGWG